jgi:putative heme-binding domain-containing protein
MWFGLGENLGADYVVRGSDGTEIQGGGEGGSVYACRADGTEVRRVATGFWNPYHLYRSRSGQLFGVDNDPDARPPCRLLHIVEGGDYGFKFRYGRNGLHPFHAWNGELPGTLPMISGTGEAPSGVVGVEEEGWPADYGGALLVTSWGDHRIERFRLLPHGASYRSTLEPIVAGDENFRPVGIAMGRPGELYFSDWVDKSYELHGKGRLWRLRVKEPTSQSQPHVPQPARDVVAEHRPTVEMLADADPFVRTAGRRELARQLSAQQIGKQILDQPSQRRVEYLLAYRDMGGEPTLEVIRRALSDEDVAVRLVAVQWIGDRKLKEFASDVETLVKSAGRGHRQLLESSLATMEVLEKGYATPDAGSQFAVRLLDRGDLDAEVVLALARLVPADNAWWTAERILSWALSSDERTGIEAVRTLRDSPLRGRRGLLERIAGDEESVSASVRAEAILGLGSASLDNDQAIFLLDLAEQSDPLVSATARRVIERSRPSPEGLPRRKWSNDEVLAACQQAGSASAGERLFFDPGGPGCYRCHQVSGRGHSAGPDLTTIARGADRHRLIRSIVEPSAEIAPMYVPWIVVTDDGRRWTGLLVREGLKGEQYYLTPAGTEEVVLPTAIDDRRAGTESVMPADVLSASTPQEVSDLITFLEGLR